MDESGFATWLDGQDLAPHTRKDAMANCRRVEHALSIDLDELSTETGIEQAKHRLWDHTSNARVIGNLCWSMRKYIRFRADRPKAHAAKAGS